jgi:hypothetical protein
VAFLKSPFAPETIYSTEDVFKEDGYLILKTRDREGAVVVNIGLASGLYRQFSRPVANEPTPNFVKALSIYVDGKELKIGHAGYEGFNQVYYFATILDPFLWPGEHVGKIVILLPSSETMEYEWHFEITWW